MKGGSNLGAVTSQRFYSSPGCERGKTCGELPVWRIKIHERRRFECQGLRRRSPPASVLGDEYQERLKKDGGERYGIKGGGGRDKRRMEQRGGLR